MMTLAWRAARHRSWLACGAWLGLSIGLKPFLLLFVPVLADQRTMACRRSVISSRCGIDRGGRDRIRVAGARRLVDAPPNIRPATSDCLLHQWLVDGCRFQERLAARARCRGLDRHCRRHDCRDPKGRRRSCLVADHHRGTPGLAARLGLLHAPPNRSARRFGSRRAFASMGLAALATLRLPSILARRFSMGPAVRRVAWIDLHLGIPGTLDGGVSASAKTRD